MELEKAIQTVLDYWEQSRGVPDKELVDATKVVVDEMKCVIAFEDVIEYCLAHRPISQKNGD